MSRLRSPLALAIGIVAALAAPTAALGAPTATAVPAATSTPPSSMASLGDSISRGFDACGFYVDCPVMSFSTGDYSPINSHYRRIQARNPAITGHNNNDAMTGAKVIDLAGQAAAAVSQGVQYVTILIGANDACTSGESTMTPVTTFRSELTTALGELSTGLPGAKVLIISIPNIYRLWQVASVDPLAVATWSTLGICQSMLANPTSTARSDVDRRARVLQRVVDFNTTLANACTAYGANCLFDGNAVFNYAFSLSQISIWDYFHPNTSGQTALADTSYRAGFNW